jgi:hypothetical protein
MTVNLPVAFALGLFSTVHCLGMCGGIITALSLGLPDVTQADRKRFAIRVCSYNLGRVLSYALAGALAGAFGHALLAVMGSGAGHYMLRGLAGLMLVLLGLHLAGWLNAARRLEGAGMRLWAIIRPIGGYFLPVDNVYKGLLVGCVWGWLPCGLVYSVLLWSATHADPVAGALIMLGFGLGTLPGMITAGLFSGALRELAARTNVRKVFAAIIIIFGLLTPWLPSADHNHDTATPTDHTHH